MFNSFKTSNSCPERKSLIHMPSPRRRATGLPAIFWPARTDELLPLCAKRNRAFERGAWQAAVSLAAARSQTAMTTGRCLTLNRAQSAFLSAFAVGIGICAKPATWAWSNRDHEIIAIIAADNLAPAVREQVARIL
jgi:hypothetical protein